MTTFHTTTLSNGLRIIQEPCPTENVYCGILIGAGTRHEDPNDSGLAHFCEHVTFKGTERRKACHIRNCLERIGGDLNAYTNKEETTYYATVQSEHFARAVDILTDIVFHSIYPAAELKKETEVIIDEIDSYRDSPAELIYDEFEAMLFRNHPLGRDILGNAERLRTYSTEDALRFTRKNYVPSNATFYVLGNVPFEKTVRLIERATADFSPANDGKGAFTSCPQQLLPPYQQEDRVSQHDTHQAHVLIGNRCFGRSHAQRPALFLLSNILGGPGMNALLSVDLREKRGLVYTVDCSAFHYSDTGVWSVYFGCDETDVEHCRKRVMHILEQMREKPLSETRLQAAKRQAIGQIMLGQDHFESRALAMGKVYAHSGEHRDIQTLINRLQSVTPSDIQLVAQDIFAPDQLSTLVYK